MINPHVEVVILNEAQRSEESLTLIHNSDPSLCSEPALSITKG